MRSGSVPGLNAYVGEKYLADSGKQPSRRIKVRMELHQPPQGPLGARAISCVQLRDRKIHPCTRKRRIPRKDILP